MIIDLLKKNKTEKDKLVQSGNAYLIAGLLRGLGIETIESMKLLDQLEEGVGAKKETIEEK